MIVPMSHFSLLILKNDEQALLEKLQRFEDVHFKTLNEPDDFLKKADSAENEALASKCETIAGLIAEIEQHERKNRPLVAHSARRQSLMRSVNTSSMTFEELEQKALAIDIDGLLSTIDKVDDAPVENKKTKVLYRIVPWETEKLRDEELVEIRDGKAVLGTVLADAADMFAEELRRMGKVYAIVSREIDGSILFVLKATSEQLEHLDILVSKYHLKRRSVEGVRMNWEIMNFRRTIDKMISRQNRTDGSLVRMADYKESLQIYLAYLDNLLLRSHESSKFLQSDSCILVEGWIPADREAEFSSYIEDGSLEICVLKLEEASRESDEVPVKLKNNRIVSSFESLTKMYSTPRYNEIDPTALFTPFYFLFFGMMLADVGYGLIMLAACAAALKFFDLKPGFAGMVRFLFYLSFSVVGWGFVYGSFFCGLIPLKGLINPNSEYMRVLIMALVFGFIHIFMALGIKAYIYIREKHPLYALFDVGFWYMTLIGIVLLLFGSSLPSPLSRIPGTAVIALTVLGMAGIVLTNGRTAKTVPGKMAMGLYSLYGLTNYIGDIISYSRLMALGLAGGSIGLAVNLIIDMLQGSGIIGIIASVPVFIFFHLFNMFISGLSSYVHSARLTYVEFFGKFYEGGGVSFKPFRAADR